MAGLFNIGVGVNPDGVRKLAHGFSARMLFTMSEAVGKSLALIQSEHMEKQVRRAGSSTARPDSNTWTTRKGHLRRSFHIDWTPGQQSGAYGSDLKRAYKIEHGGKIKSDRPGGSLAIPTKFAPTAAGVPLWPRDVAGLFFKTSRSGKPYLAQLQGGKLRPVYLLRKSVTLPPRPALDRAIAATEERRSALFLRAVDMSVERTT